MVIDTAEKLLVIIDEAMKEISGRQMTPTSEMTDVLLDLRGFVSQLLTEEEEIAQRA